ncbi:hypothetical protein BGX33_011722, partial [Mortierella sp. NVP41]
MSVGPASPYPENLSPPSSPASQVFRGGHPRLELSDWVYKDLRDLRMRVRKLSKDVEIDACLSRLQVFKNNRFHKKDDPTEEKDDGAIG